MNKETLGRILKNNLAVSTASDAKGFSFVVALFLLAFLFLGITIPYYLLIVLAVALVLTVLSCLIYKVIWPLVANLEEDDK